MATHLKAPSLTNYPAYLILTNTPQQDSIHNIHKIRQRFQFSILNSTQELHMNPIGELHEISHISLVSTTKIEELWKTNTQKIIPTPDIMPKFHSSPISNLKLNIVRKSRLATTNSLP